MTVTKKKKSNAQKDPAVKKALHKAREKNAAAIREIAKKESAQKKKKKKKKTMTDKAIAANRRNAQKSGRPKIEIDWYQFDKLCQLHCTHIEFASWFNCDFETIETAVKREKGMGFSEYFRLKAGMGKTSLRRAQWAKALGGDNTMMIWMGKQHLGQSDKAYLRTDNKTEVKVDALEAEARIQHLLKLRNKSEE